ncbi:flagellar basal body P-ring formation protein FlgA [Shewanella sp. 202IG2-18]|uniref:flagellar basal body P-ring formation chaperone FlgA n=1 Tax=Parashewanella hymeniacidonis TaxID=2807618 RepID=UPI001960ED0A|nr:flagellar basal body P-ring formation chaperone FlgA [Parashewanella hymeniacidonis]MBM7072864.1 flagellar basal body P-ring formation protein FlgA [Parashewanella hymeniacidonis]
MKKIEQIQPKLTLRSSRAVSTLSRCSSEIRFTKKSDKLLGVQQWKASCSSPNRTVMMRSQLSIKALLPVTKETLQRGQVIQPDMLTMQWVNYPSYRAQIVTQMSQLRGKRVSHKLRRLKAIQTKQLISNIWVMAGEHVIIEANANGFSANMKGKALQSGGEGQAIKVKNLSSGKVILAYPIGKGKVETRF